MSNTMKGLGVIAAGQRPFVQFLYKNWPLALIAGYALFVRGKERWTKGEFNSYNLFADAGLVLTPLVGLALLNNLAQEENDRKVAAQAAAATAPATTTATDASSIASSIMQAIQQPSPGTSASTTTSS